MSIKIHFVVSIDPYRDEEIVGGQGFYDEKQAVVLEAECEEKLGKIYSFITRDIVVKFSHRNGETADPEIRGNYWIEINTQPGGLEPAFWDDIGRKWSSRYGGYAVPSEPFRIWGPIPVPERKP